MSKEAVRRIVEGRYHAFGGLSNELKSYPNQPEKPTPATGLWSRLNRIEFVANRIVSVGSEPCTRRAGTIVIDVFDRLEHGTRAIFELTDQIEDYFETWTDPTGKFWTDAANTFDNSDDGDSEGYFKATVYIPFIYEP